MIKRKLKTCKICGEKKYLFSHGRCLECTKKQEQYSLNPISNNEKERRKKYKFLRKEYLKDHLVCEICGVPANEIHHKEGRVGDRLFRSFMVLCRGCHTKLHDTEEGYKEAVQNGWIVPFKKD